MQIAPAPPKIDLNIFAIFVVGTKHMVLLLDYYIFVFNK